MTHAVKIVEEYLNSVINDSIEQLQEKSQQYISDTAVFRCGRPIGDVDNTTNIVTQLWSPLKGAFHNLKAITHIAMDGVCEIDGQHWVSVMGQYAGNFANDLYSIPATHTYTYLRYGHFFCVQDGKITQGYVLFDYIRLMQNAGVAMVPRTIGGDDAVMPPSTANGNQLHTIRDEKSSDSSMELVMSMLSELLVDKNTVSGSQREFWDSNMTWYGPSGIGTYHTLEGFKHYRNAFLHTFPDRDYGNHCGVISKNDYVSVVGWRGVHATHCGSGWLGLAPTGKKIYMPLMDFWRVDNDRIVENWVLIDIVDIFYQLGVDLFANIGHIYHKELFTLPDIINNTAIQDEKDTIFKEYLKKYLKKH